VPRELFAVERLHLKPLPAWIPEVYRLHQRLVDLEGYVALNSNRYSVPVSDRPPRGGARDQGQDRDNNWTPDVWSRTGALRSRAPASPADRAPATTRAEGAASPIRIPKRRPLSAAALPTGRYVTGFETAEPQGG